MSYFIYFMLCLLIISTLVGQVALVQTPLLPSGDATSKNGGMHSLVRFNKPYPDPEIGTNCSLCRAGNSSNGSATNALEQEGNRYSKDQLDLTKHIRYVIYPILLISCTLGNKMNIIVLAHQKPKTSTNSYMLSVAMADVIYMWLSFPCSYLLDYFGHNSSYAEAVWPHRGPIEWARRTGAIISDWLLENKQDARHVNRDGIDNFLFTEISLLFLESSRFRIIVLFSIERLCVTIWPLYFRGSQTAKHGWINCGIILIIACMFMMSHAVLNFSFDQALDKDAAPWRQKWFQMQQHAEAADIIINMFGLFAINACIIALFIRKSKISISANAGAGISQERVKSSSGLLFGCSTLFLLTHLPWLVHTILQIIGEKGSFRYTDNGFEFAYPLLQTCMDVNYSLNCCVYLMVSKSYRKELGVVFREHRQTVFRLLHLPCYQKVTSLQTKGRVKLQKTKLLLSPLEISSAVQSTTNLITSAV